MKENTANKILEVLADRIRDLEMEVYLLESENKRLKSELAERTKGGDCG